ALAHEPPRVERLGDFLVRGPQDRPARVAHGRVEWVTEPICRRCHGAANDTLRAMAYDYAKHFSEQKILHDLMTTPDERTWKLTAPEREPERRSIVLYLGCNVLRTSHMIRTVTALFDHLGLDYVAVGGVTYCCGIVH